jgi:hypothetical protein
MNRFIAVALLFVGPSFAGCMGHGKDVGRFGTNARLGPEHDRPFPLGAVTDAFWETQQTNAEAADFVFYDHEFVGNEADLTPGAKKKLMQVALRLEHVPFPIAIEQSQHNRRPQLDALRRRTVVEQLARIGVEDAERRVVIAPNFAEGFSASEGESAYYRGLGSGNGNDTRN